MGVNPNKDPLSLMLQTRIRQREAAAKAQVGSVLLADTLGPRNVSKALVTVAKPA